MWIKCSDLVCHVLYYPIDGQGTSFVLLISYSWTRLDTGKVSVLSTVEANGSDSRRRFANDVRWKAQSNTLRFLRFLSKLNIAFKMIGDWRFLSHSELQVNNTPIRYFTSMTL